MAVLPKDHLNHILIYVSITKGCISINHLNPYVWQYYQRIILIISLCMAVLPKDHLNHILMYGSITKGSSLSYPYVWQYYQRINHILMYAVLPVSYQRITIILIISLCMAVLPKDHLNHILMYGSITKGTILIISLCMAVLPKDHLNHILMYGSITKGSS